MQRRIEANSQTTLGTERIVWNAAAGAALGRETKPFVGRIRAASRSSRRRPCLRTRDRPGRRNGFQAGGSRGRREVNTRARKPVVIPDRNPGSGRAASAEGVNRSRLIASLLTPVIGSTTA